jgi:NTE family protein
MVRRRHIQDACGSELLPLLGFLSSRHRAPRLALALQGGGAHGAFTWGVLDRLLEAGIAIAAVSGTSAGACNAAALADGWRAEGAAGARARLDLLWRRIADQAEQIGLPTGEFGTFALGLAAHLFSPYEFNPVNLSPLRDLLSELIDFERLRRAPPFPLLVAATNLRTGRGRLFAEHELTVDTVLASAAVPQLHHPVEIGGELYWDGGFTSNPPLMALAQRSGAPLIVVVRINPVTSPAVPTSAAAIRHRVAELMFGQPLRHERAQLRHAQALGRGPAGWLSPGLRRLARVRVATISDDATIGELPPATRLQPHWPVLARLRDAGRTAAERFLARLDPAAAADAEA